MHFWVDILIVLYICGFETARLGEWHSHNINRVKVINASCSDSSDYSITAHASKEPPLLEYAGV